MRVKTENINIIDEVLLYTCLYRTGFPGGSEVKVSSCNVGDLGSIPGSGRSPGRGNATHSSILAWEIPWIEEPSGVAKSWT